MDKYLNSYGETLYYMGFLLFSGVGVANEIYGQAHSTTEGQGASGTLMIKPPKESYQLNQVQVVQSPKLQRLIDNEEPYLEDTSHAPT